MYLSWSIDGNNNFVFAKFYKCGTIGIFDNAYSNLYFPKLFCSAAIRSPALFIN
jgi:hypothetical protein